MSRKLNWNKSLNNPDANVVHEVVRSYITTDIDKDQLQINQQDTNLTNVSSNVKKNVLKQAQSDASILSTTNVSSNTLNDVIKNISSNVQTNVEKDTILNVLDNVVIDVVSNPLTDVISNVTNDVSINVSNITPDKENTPIISKKKRENFKRDPLSNSVEAMAEWHTRAEQKVYIVMYTETIMHRQRTRYFSYKELSTKTGLRNNRTIINAVIGLQEKKSIDVSPSKRGEKLGREYSIYPPQEILSRRREMGMKIHPQTKKILNIDFDK